MATKLKLIFHSTVLTVYLLTIWFRVTCIDFTVSKDVRIQDIDRYKERYYTGWNFLMHVAYFVLALTEDIQEYLGQKRSTYFLLTYVKANFFTTLMVPSTAFVTSMFWSVYHYDRELVYPPEADSIVPSWFNHMVHSFISIFLVLEFYFTAHHPEVGFKCALIGVTAINVIYYTVFFYHYYTVGRFLYPLFHQFTWSQMAAFILGIYTCLLLVTRIGILAQNCIKSFNYRKCNINNEKILKSK